MHICAHSLNQPLCFVLFFLVAAVTALGSAAPHDAVAFAQSKTHVLSQLNCRKAVRPLPNGRIEKGLILRIKSSPDLEFKLLDFLLDCIDFLNDALISMNFLF